MVSSPSGVLNKNPGKKIWCAVKALIWHQHRFLALAQRVGNQTFWDLPGGRIEYGETPLDALQREIHEETGLNVSFQSDQPIGVWWFFRKTDGDQVVCITYACTADTDQVRLKNLQNNELLTRFEWVTPQQFLKRIPSGQSNDSLKRFIQQHAVQNPVHAQV